MSKNNLTANQAAVLTAIREGFHSSRDEDFAAVFDTFAADLADRGTIKDKKTAKVVLNQMTKKRLLAVDPESEVLTLTDAGKFAMTEVLFEGNPEGLAEQEAHLASLENYRPATDEELDAALVAIAEHSDSDAPFEEEEDLLGTGSIPIVEAAPAADPVTVETIAENYTVKEWTEGGTEADIEWTETTFKDGSMTLKRRQKVSGAWRTDYWGMEADQTKKHFTSAKACKMARAYGTYTEAI